MTAEASGGRTRSEAVAQARRDVACAQARLAALAVGYADRRIGDGLEGTTPAGVARPKPGAFAADELSVVLREQPWTVRCLIARTRRLTRQLPTVWDAFIAGDLDAAQVRVIDRVARRAAEPATLTTIDDQAVDAAQTRTPQQLHLWLLRLVVACEPDAFARRHRRALAERRVQIVQGADGIGYVTGEVSASDAAAIDATLAAAARTLGADDPRTDAQRRADLFADLLLGRLHYTDDDEAEVSAETAEHATSRPTTTSGDGGEAHRGEEDTAAGEEPVRWLEVEDVDPNTGELLGTRLVPVDAEGQPVPTPTTATNGRIAFIRTPRTLRIGVVVPLSSLLGASDAAGELADRSGLVSGEILRHLIADTLDSDSSPDDQVLFTRLLTDDGGRLLNTTELGRHPSARLAQAIKIRAGTCTFPTCTIPADRCDLDHHQPCPTGRTHADNLDPLCRRHHRGKTFAWLASRRDHDTVSWTLPDADRYQCVDEPLPIGKVAA